MQKKSAKPAKKQRKPRFKMPKILLRDKITDGMVRMAKTVIKQAQEKTGKKKVIKKLLVKQWLLNGFTITARQSSRLFGADRLSSIIFDLRKEGMSIDSPIQPGVDRFKNKVEYSIYRWLGEIPVIRKRKNKAKPGQVPTFDFCHRYPMSDFLIKSRIKNHLVTVLGCNPTPIKMGFLKGYRNLLCTTSKGKFIFVIDFKND